MSLAQFRTRTLVWLCVSVVALATGFGQTLHQLAGIRHDCQCGVAASDQCEDQACPFSHSDVRHADSDSEQENSPATPSDCCSICRLLAHLNNGLFELPVLESQAAPMDIARAVETTLYCPVAVVGHSPRGPPRTLVS